jgi:transcriptional regulator with XRE-family HTH domain
MKNEHSEITPLSKDPAGIARRMQQARISRGLTLSRLAALSGVTCIALSAIENGKSGYSLYDLNRARKALGLSLSYVLDGEGNGMTGIELIAVERKRQIEEEGFTAEHDDQWQQGEIAQAAATYASLPYQVGMWINWRKLHWPWDIKWYKPETDRIREMVKVGALAAAEIDRLQRLEEL